MKRVAGSRRPEREPEDDFADGAMVLIALVPSARGLEVRLQNPMAVPEEDVAAAIEEALAQLKGTHDRARGMW